MFVVSCTHAVRNPATDSSEASLDAAVPTCDPPPVLQHVSIEIAPDEAEAAVVDLSVYAAAAAGRNTLIPPPAEPTAHNPTKETNHP